MNVEFIRNWIAALRSGQYTQTNGHLRDVYGYCCLGVGCDVAKKMGLTHLDWTKPESDNPALTGLFEFGGLTGQPPALLHDLFGTYKVHDLFVDAMTWNDKLGMSFYEIAYQLENRYKDNLKDV